MFTGTAGSTGWKGEAVSGRASTLTGPRWPWVVLVMATGASVAAVVLGWAHPRFGATHALVSATTVGFVLLGVVLTTRMPKNPIGWLFGAAGVFLGIADFSYGYASRALLDGWDLPLAPAADWATHWTFAPGLVCAGFAMLVFPDGRLPTSRWRWFVLLAGGWSFIAVASAAVLTWPYRGQILTADTSQVLGESLDYLAIALLPVGICIAGSVVARYRRASGVERLQIKWFMYATCLFLLGGSLTTIDRVPVIVADLVHNTGFAAIPAAIAVSIFRYRLYEIERIISRTVTYALVTATLVGVYGIGVIGLGGTVRGLSGRTGDDLVVAASTLLVAGVFGPLRRRVQGSVDRRFNRVHYDARRAMDGLARRVRHDVDIDVLRGGLVRVVAPALGPKHVSIWLVDRP